MSFFLFSVGNNITGQEVTATPTHADLILGTLIVAVALWLVITCGLRRDASDGNPFGVSLICFGLLFTAMITAGRAWTLGLAGRYAMFEILLWVGCYLVLLERPNATGGAATAPNLVGEGPMTTGAVGGRRVDHRSSPRWKKMSTITAHPGRSRPRTGRPHYPKRHHRCERLAPASTRGGRCRREHRRSQRPSCAK